MSSIGRLLTPYTEVKWGDLELSAWDYGDGYKRPVVFDVEFSFEAGDEKVNTASFSFDPSPVGFKAYVKCTNKDNIAKPITIKMGYENGSYIEAAYYFQDVEFVTGSDQQIKINLAGLHKAAMTSAWWTEYIGDGTKEFSLKELWDLVGKKVGYEFVWSDEALKKLKDLPKISQAAIVQENLGTFLIRTANKHGYYLEWPTGSAKDNKKIAVKIGALEAREKDLLKVAEKDVNNGKVANGADRVNKRYAFILGPTLVASVSRKSKAIEGDPNSSATTAHTIRIGGGQQSSTGQLNSGATRTDPKPAATISTPNALAPQKNNSLETLTGDARRNMETAISTVSQAKGAQPGAAPTPVAQVTGGQSQNRPPGASTPGAKDTKQCVNAKNGKAMTEKQRAACLKKLADAQEKKRIGALSECSCEVFMVPYMVGIQPKDFICFPSLNYEDPYIEDWEVSNVAYKQQGAAITISLSGSRPAPGGDPLITKEDLKKLEERVKSMKTPKQWENYYWSVVTPPPSPTSSAAPASSSRYDTSQIDSA